jgi:methyl-accepting chemotaxis protein
MGSAIDGIARGAKEQSSSAASAAVLTAQISSIIQQVTSSAETVSRESGEATRLAHEGAAIVADTVKGMENIKLKVGLSARKVEEMGARSSQVGMIVETIQDIAAQTNLLALNAAIEAARAGDHGKGFAVVADEVRKLAERANSSTKEISGLIKGIQTAMQEAVLAMAEGDKEVEVGVGKANAAGQALENILKAAEAVREQAALASNAASQMGASAGKLVSAADQVSAVVQENTVVTGQMSASSDEVGRAIETITSISEENSAAIEEVSASSEEMSAQVQEVTAEAMTLAQMANTLQQVVAQFRLAQA